MRGSAVFPFPADFNFESSAVPETVTSFPLNDVTLLAPVTPSKIVCVGRNYREHAAELGSKAVVYINSDSNGRGTLRAGGSHSLEKFVNEVSRDVPDAGGKRSVWEAARAHLLDRANEETKKELASRADLRIEALGSGSDYTPFLQHLGIASLNIAFGGEDQYSGVYHSIYDSFDHYTRFVDPGFDYGIALMQTTGRAVLRSASADVLPFEFLGFSDAVEKYAKEITRLLDNMREETKRRNSLIANRTLEAVSDPAQPYFAPNLQDQVPYLNFAPLQNAVSRLQKAARDARLDDKTAMQLERLLTSVVAEAERRRSHSS